jgi:hypothetical protein
MKKRSNKRVALLIPFALLASFAFAGLPGSASAQSNTANKVVDYETLTGSLNSDGSISRLRLLDDLRVTGTGDVVVVDPNSTTGLRNLMGYSGPEAAGSNQVKYTINNLDGTKQYVTVSDPVGKQPPVAMSIAYTLNGQSVASGSDLVGKTGDIGIAFTVKNTTSKTMNVTYKDTQGNTLTSPQQVPLPLVAQLQVTLPPNIFTQLNAAGADIFTDAFGNKIVNWALVLVPPVGDVTQTVTLLAHADGFALGPVQLAAAPVAPQSRNYLDFAENQFANGIEQSGSLYTGTTQIADNLDTLHTGTLKLVGGIEKLYKGAQKLATGLNSAIAPAGTLMAGIGKLQTGLSGFAGGLNQVKGGVPAGAEQVKSGVAGLDAGLAQVVDCLNGTGAPCKDKSGPHAITGPYKAAIVPQLSLGLNACLVSIIGGSCNGNDSVTRIAQQLKTAADACLSGAGPTACNGAAPSILTLANSALGTAACSGDPGCATAVGTIAALVPQLQTAADQALVGIQDLISGLLNGPHGNDGILAGLSGIDQIATGLATRGIGGAPTAAQIAGCQAQPPTDKCTVRAGLAALLEGVTSGFDQLLAGLGSDSPAAVQACVAHPDKQHCTLLSLSGALTNGLGQLQTGLQSGLGQAATGATTIATCLGAVGNKCQGGPSVKSGMSQIEQGVYAINELGVKEVARQAHDVQGTVGAQLAVMQAEDKRAKEESLLYGPPTSDQAQTVVGGSSVLLTMNALDNGHSETVSRGVYAGIALLLLVGLGMLGLRGMRKPAA